MATAPEPSVGRIVALLAAFLIPGVPLVAITWNAVNAVAAGQVERLLVAIPTAGALAVLLALFGRRLRRLEAGR
ncbi:MAG TPA: hypothetical protein VF136_19215 [Methylomirabilota bacterium]